MPINDYETDAISGGQVLTLSELNALRERGVLVTAQHGLVGLGANYGMVINQNDLPIDLGLKQAYFIPFSEGILSAASSSESNSSLTAAYQNLAALIKTNGTLWTWGNSNVGRSTGASASRNKPSQVGTDTNWTKVDCGDGWALALKSNGTMHSWGNSTGYKTGQNLTTTISAPTMIGVDNTWVDICAGTQFGYAIKSNGTLWSWGVNTNGMTAQGTTTGNTTVPTQVGTATDWLGAKMSAGGQSGTSERILIVKTNGTMWGAGYNATYGLGNNSTTAVTTMTQLGNSTSDWANVFACHQVGFGIKNDGSLWACGDKSSYSGSVGYQTTWALYNSGNPSFVWAGTLNGLTPSSITAQATAYAIDSENNVWCGGNPLYAVRQDISIYSGLASSDAGPFNLKKVGTLPGTFLGASMKRNFGYFIV